MSFADIMSQAFNNEKDPTSDEAILKAYYDEVLLGDDSDCEDISDDEDLSGVASDDPSGVAEMETIEESAKETEEGETSEVAEGDGPNEGEDPNEGAEEDESEVESDGSDMPIFYPIPSIERITRFVLLQYRKANTRYFIEEVRATVRLIRLVYHADPTDPECRETSELVREVWSGN